jgi:hypothetical protein
MKHLNLRFGWPNFAQARTGALRLLSVCLFVLGASAAFADGSGGWEHVEEEDGINLWKLEVPGKDLPGFRGQAFIKGSLEDVMKQMLDWKRHTEWMYKCEESTMLKQFDENHAIMYNRTDAPWPVWDRDVVLDTVISRSPDGKAAAVKFKNTDSSLRAVPENVVRMPTLVGFYKLWQVEPNKVKVLYQIEADVGGSLPKWVAARTAKDLPYQTLYRLRERVEGKK